MYARKDTNGYIRLEINPGGEGQRLGVSKDMMGIVVMSDQRCRCSRQITQLGGSSLSRPYTDGMARQYPFATFKKKTVGTKRQEMK